MLKLLLLALVLVACDHGTRDTPAPAPAPAPLACGDKTCTGSDICAEIHDSDGAAPPPGQPAWDAVSFQCTPASLAGPGTACSPIENRRQRCSSLKPSVATPPPPPPAPPIACGELTCAAQQICIDTMRAGGVAPPPDTHREPSHQYRCSPSPDPACERLDAHHQPCVARIPSARPR